MEQRDERPCPRVVTEQMAREHLGDRFKAQLEYSREREAKLRDFESRMHEDEKLQAQVRESPLATLEKNRIVEPQDVVQVTYGGRGFPDLPGFEDFEFPKRFCYPICHFHWEWVCFPWNNLHICYRRLRLHCHWHCT